MQESKQNKRRADVICDCGSDLVVVAATRVIIGGAVIVIGSPIHKVPSVVIFLSLGNYLPIKCLFIAFGRPRLARVLVDVQPDAASHCICINIIEI